MSEGWIILGASSAVARTFARAVARQGASLVLAGRDLDDLARSAADLQVRFGVEAGALSLDAREVATHDAFVEACADQLSGRRINLFLAFGSMPEQANCDADFALARRMVETNYLGAVSLLTRFAPLLERQGGGQVVALGSVAGDRGRLGNYLYGSTKAALAVYLQGYRARLHRSGCHVLTVKPGFLDTAMTWPLGPLPMAMAPEAFAKAVLRALARRREIVYIPWVWRWIMLLIRAVPERLFKRTDI